MSPNPPTKVVTRRVFGFIVDVIIYYAVVAGAFALIAKKDGYTSGSFHAQVEINNHHYVVSGGHFFAWMGVHLLYLLLVPVVLEGITGWTPGKLLFGTRVVKADGSPPGFGRSLVRLLFWIVDGFFFYLVAFVTALATKDNRRVGDLVGGTYVVRTSAVGQPPVVPPASAAPPGPAPAPAAPGGEAPPPPPPASPAPPPPPPPAQQ
jgi:uncharacterized RDD family membrane protein YckC